MALGAIKMYARLQSLINRHSVNFATGNIGAILPLYAPVLPVYIAGNRVTLGDHDNVAATLESHFLAVREQGFNLFVGKLAALSIPRGGRFQAIVDWTYGRKTGEIGPGWPDEILLPL